MSGTKAVFALAGMLLLTREVVCAQGARTNEDVALIITGSVERSLKLGLSDLTRMPRKSVHVKDHDGKAVTYEGVSLMDVLKLAGVPSGDGLSGPNMATCILAEAKDGYRGVFALAELDPRFSDNEVLLADRANGEPLSAAQGPLRIVTSHENGRRVGFVTFSGFRWSGCNRLETAYVPDDPM
jgi:DMSO/TMAO reductase YedYZ molybdopterin-dependent catalytic subunit